jgi:hypothetical protein
MADSNALRQRRKRAHAAGDHSLCRRCDGRVRLAVVPAGGAVLVDARVALERLAARLEAAHVADPADAAVARVLKDTLLALGGLSGPPDDGDDDPLADLRALAESVS